MFYIAVPVYFLKSNIKKKKLLLSFIKPAYNYVSIILRTPSPNNSDLLLLEILEYQKDAQASNLLPSNNKKRKHAAQLKPYSACKDVKP